MPRVQITGSAQDLVSFLNGATAVSEAVVSRLKAMRAQLEIAKLQKEIRDLGGDPEIAAVDTMGDQSDGWPWEALLKQAQANLETAHAIRLQIQLKLSKESAADREPDRLEAWIVADCDAEAGAVIGEQIVHQAEGSRQGELHTVDSTGSAEALQAVVAKPIVGTKRVPSVLELLAAQGAAAVGAEGDKSLTVCEASKAVENSGASDNGELDAHRAMQEQFDAMSTLKQPEGFIKSLEANGIVVDINGGWKRCAGHAPSKHPNKPLEGSILVPEKPSEKGKAIDKLPEDTNPQDGEVHIQLPTEGAEEFDWEADNKEHYFFETFDFEGFRRTLRKANGGAGETTKKTKNERSRQIG